MQTPTSNYSGMANRWLVIILCVAILSFCATGYAQLAGTGSIQGSITDSTGAFIGNATVTVTDVATLGQAHLSDGHERPLQLPEPRYRDLRP